MTETTPATSTEPTLPQYCTCSTLVLGCGNVLFGDDGFGPAVVEYLSDEGSAPEDLCLLNVGTSVREILFDLVLSEARPQKIIIVDSMECGRSPGSVAELDLDAIPVVKLDDFSMHQMPTSNLLRELRDLCGVDVKVIVSQPASIPDEVKPGLSAWARDAIKDAAETVRELSGSKWPEASQQTG